MWHVAYGLNNADLDQFFSTFCAANLGLLLILALPDTRKIRVISWANRFYHLNLDKSQRKEKDILKPS